MSGVAQIERGAMRGHGRSALRLEGGDEVGMAGPKLSGQVAEGCIRHARTAKPAMAA